MEKLLNVTLFRPKHRTVPCASFFNVGTPLTQEVCDGAVILRPTTTKYHMIPENTWNMMVEYLCEIFSSRNKKRVQTLLRSVINDSTISLPSRLYPTLFEKTESIVRAWNRGLFKFRYKVAAVPPLKDRRAAWNAAVIKDKAVNAFTTYVRRYNRGHSNQFMLSPDIVDSLGWNDRQPVSLIERDDGSYMIRLAEKSETRYLLKMTHVMRPGTIHGFRYLYMTKSQKAALGISSELWQEGVDLKFTFDLVKNNLIIVEPLSDEDRETLPTIPTGCKADWYDLIRIVKRHVSGPIILPVEFTRRYAINQNDSIRTEIKDNRLFIYGKTSACDFCGEIAEKDSLVSVPICGNCADVIDDVRNTVKNAPDMNAAIVSAKNELLNALKRIENYEGGTK